MKGLVMFGTGTFAQVIARYFLESGEAISAFTIDADYVQSLEFRGFPVVPFEEIQIEYPPDDFDLVIAVTQQNNHRDLMSQKTQAAWEKGYATPSYRHPDAFVDDTVKAGQGCIISPGAIIEPYTTLGNGVVVRSGAYIGHHSHLGCFSYIAPRVSMSGHVTIGAGAFIGNNATIRDRTIIGHHAVIGAGSVVLRDVKPDEVYRGYPARLLSVSGKDVEI